MPATEVRPMPASSLTRELIAGPAGKIETDINGGFVQTRVARRMKTARLVLVAAAVNRFRAEAVPHDTLVIHGEHDDVVPLAAVLDWARPQSLPVVGVPGGEHFFHGRLALLAEIVQRHFRR